ncbi:hypothetical protein CWC15_16655 [Pseudoalteromonas spongiae]|nr:hypothetical protein CWC15_16655 [Pseudoalteromonas spongiae]
MGDCLKGSQHKTILTYLLQTKQDNKIVQRGVDYLSLFWGFLTLYVFLLKLYHLKHLVHGSEDILFLGVLSNLLLL